tara:strand:- start:404 stop:682 length:279 start_codon:yes stop_codon:yes gene_type:complete
MATEESEDKKMIKNKFGQCPLDTAVRDLDILLDELIPHIDTIFYDFPLQTEAFRKKLNRVQLEEFDILIRRLQGIKQNLEESVEDNLLSEFK